MLDKYLLSDFADDSIAYIICQVLASQIFTVPIILFMGVDFVYPQSLLALFFGCLQVVPSLFYIKALKVEEASKVSALEYVYPLFVFVGSALLLGEVLEIRHCAGGLFLLIGTLFISFNKNASSKGANCNGPMKSSLNYSSGSSGNRVGRFFGSLSPAIKPFFSYWILTAAYYITLKHLLVTIDEWNLYIWTSLGGLAAVLPMLAVPSVRSEVRSFFNQGGKAVGALISEETFQFLGIIFSIFAYAIGSVTLVSSVGALQPIMTVLLILMLGSIMPKLACATGERTDWDSLKQKGVSFILVAIGIYFVS